MIENMNCINELLFRLLDNDISDEDFLTLSTWLKADDAVQTYYCHFMEDCGAMSVRPMVEVQTDDNVFESNPLLDFSSGLWHQLADYEETAPPVEIPEPEPELIQNVAYPPIKKNRMSKLSVYVLVTSAAAMLFFMLFLRLFPAHNPYQAVITDSYGAHWADPSKPASIGTELNFLDGDRWLQAGFVKLLFGRGAEVVIESPARFEILSNNKLNVLEGRAYSKVPKGARGFTIFTPNSQVVDLGTEFGLEVLGDSSSVHMIEGEASILPDSSLRSQKLINLTAGYAKSIGQNGITQDIKVDKSKFVADISSNEGTIYRADKRVQVGTWSRRLSVNLERDLRTDGLVIQAVNLGPQSTKPATVSGISFKPLTLGGTVVGGEKCEIADVNVYEGSNNDLTSLLTTGVALDDQKNQYIEMHISGLKAGQGYRIQLIIYFPWHWTDVNCYGLAMEHMYFPNLNDRSELGLATYQWHAKSTTEKIEFTSPRVQEGEWNLVHFLGYVVHEVSDGGNENMQ